MTQKLDHNSLFYNLIITPAGDSAAQPGKVLHKKVFVHLTKEAAKFSICDVQMMCGLVL